MTSQPIRGRTAELSERRWPRISVVVTNFNYGHFLGECLESVLAQSYAAVELIVVDDGSTDASAAVLARYARRITAVAQPNRGQAAAFNAGFRLTTGEIVVFLDADDLLCPHALFTLSRAWSPAFAALSFALECVDETGTSLGAYDVEPFVRDPLPFFLVEGGFPFTPTSGNAFTRSAVAPAFPLPEAQWVIGADTLLVRRAVLAGPCRRLPMVLGRYRIHGGNTYYRETSQLWQIRRGMLNIAECADYLARHPLPCLDGATQNGAVLTELARLALRMRAGVIRRGGATGFSRQVISSIRALAAAPISRRARIAMAAWLVSLAATASVSRQPLRWVEWRTRRPAWLDQMIYRMAGRREHDLRREAARPRAFSPARFGHATFGRGGADDVVPSLVDWRTDPERGGFWLCGSEGIIWVLPPSSERPIDVAVTLAAPARANGTPFKADIRQGTNVLAEVEFVDTGVLTARLSPRATTRDPLALTIRVVLKPAIFLDRVRCWLGPTARVRLDAVVIGSAARFKTGAHLPLGQTVPFPSIASAALAAGQLIEASEGGVAVAVPAVLHFWPPLVSESFEILFGLDDEQPPGWLTISSEESGGSSGVASQILFEGAVEAGSIVRFRIPLRETIHDAPVALSIGFRAEHPTDPAAVVIQSVSAAGVDPALVLDPLAPLQTQAQPPVIGPGNRFATPFAAREQGLLRGGWHVEEDGAVTLAATEGVLQVGLAPEVSEAARLTIELTPGHPLPTDLKLAVLARVDDRPPLRFVMGDAYTLEIPVAPGGRISPGHLTVRLSAGLTADHDPALLLPASLELIAVGLDDPSPIRLPALTPPQADGSGWERGLAASNGRRVEPATNVAALIEAAAATATSLADSFAETRDEPAAAIAASGVLDRLAEDRDRIVSAIDTLDPRAVEALFARAERLENIRRIGAALGLADRPGAQEKAALTLVGVSEESERLRRFAKALLTVPAWRWLTTGDLDALPLVVISDPRLVGRYVGANAFDAQGDAEIDQYLAFLLDLLDDLRRRLAGNQEGTRESQLAAEILTALRPHKILFSSLNLKRFAAALGAAIETMLTVRGRELNLARTGCRPANERLRIGVIVRNLKPAPENWILHGLFGGLDPEAHELVLYVLSSDRLGPDEVAPPGAFSAVRSLGGLTIDQSVEAIRRDCLDVFVLGGFSMGCDPLAAIVAHRLAPMQLATSAISPMSTGLASFDAFVTAEMTEPADVGEHYTEEVICLPHPVQAFDFRLGNGADACDGRVAEKTLERIRFGLPADAVILVSGAHVEKVDPALLDAWVDILTRAPGAVLVLYPFAAHWGRSFVRVAFTRRVSEALRQKGLASDRVMVLAQRAPAEVHRLLRLADVYLDSFPYSGATTVVEALNAQLPVVALTGVTQRGLQGSAWLRAFGLEDLVAASETRYVDRSVRLAVDPCCRDAARRSVTAALARHAHLNDPSAVAGWMAPLLRRLAGGDIPGPPTSAPTSTKVGRAARFDSERTRYLFHHLAKGGGTTCRSVMRAWFNIRLDEREPWSETCPPPVDLAELGPRDILWGHFDVSGLRLAERYPAVLQDPNWRLITILRDPLETVLSYYFYEIEQRPNFCPDFKPSGLGAYLRSCQGPLLSHLNCEPDDWREALDRYWFVGTLERLPECLAWLADAFGVPAPDPAMLPHENATERTVAPDPDDVAAFARRNVVDFDIYRCASERLDRRLTG